MRTLNTQGPEQHFKNSPLALILCNFELTFVTLKPECIKLMKFSTNWIFLIKIIGNTTELGTPLAQFHQANAAMKSFVDYDERKKKFSCLLCIFYRFFFHTELILGPPDSWGPGHLHKSDPVNTDLCFSVINSNLRALYMVGKSDF